MKFLSHCAIILPQLYAAGHRLPDVEPRDEEDAALRDKEDTESREREDLVRQKLASLLGKYDLYAEVFDPVFENEVVTGSLSNDLSEIYSDLREALCLYERGNFRDAVWDWKFGLQFHYGHHIVDSLRAIHQLITDHMPSDWRSS